MRYKISAPHPSNRYLDIELTIEDIEQPQLLVNLASWRPGRYELGNFAKNIQRWNAYDTNGNELPSRKLNKDTWQIESEEVSKIVIRYNYYCNQLDAGACWIDANQIYFNPVHCMLYVHERMNEKHYIEFEIPSDYEIATSLKRINDRLYRASNYHELVDSPVICSATLQHFTYKIDEVLFHVWLQGECKADADKIADDFSAFSMEQLSTMKKFPFDEYHFIVQLLPYKFYHGVEHLKNTVLALGPGMQLMSKQLYTDFVGVASHELFHAWNIKTIRPAEMHPYNYKAENYSYLGYVYEGVTTYYGDYFLARCGVYSAEEFFAEINVRLQNHFNNAGRLNMSVADSSFDSWLDGYVPGIPGRKTSIYDEGCLTAMMTDLLIRSNTANEKSLDDVMLMLFNDFALKGRGYTDADYMAAVNHVSGTSQDIFFSDYIFGTGDFLPMLQRCLDFAGCTIKIVPSTSVAESVFGMKCIQEQNAVRVTNIYPHSPAFMAALERDDEIVAVNEIKVENNFEDLLSYFSGEKIVLTVFTSQKKLRDVLIETDGKNYYARYKMEKQKEVTSGQKQFFSHWLKQDF